ncbi:MAG: hypothetical protein KBD94_01965 [Pyrinomonadaceae bacterium]|nr:hypothetical protein [Pyrinomonadaceae bacterium]
MGNRFILLACILVISLGTVVVEFPHGLVAITAVFMLSAVLLFIFRNYTSEKQFITTVFLVGLAARMAFGLMIHIFELREFFGGDALTYDESGWGLSQYWLGKGELTGQLYFQSVGTAWGMTYLTAGLYTLIGRNIFAAQSLCAVVGAAIAPMVYYCSQKIFGNMRSAKFAAVAVALFPSFIIWTGQLLKDGLIIFMLVVSITMVLSLQEKFNYAALAVIIGSMFGILSLRFYIFFMVLVAVGGSFLIGVSTTNRSILRRTFVLVILGVALTYFGMLRSAQKQYDIFGSLERIQSSRIDLVKSADSGFNEESDVSTTAGALSAIPLGFAYLMFAPFPWQAENLRQTITIPDVLVWWAMLPFLILGIIYTVKNRLRNAFPVLIFSLLLTLAYSISQGNVGTAYRQRAQIQVFLFILVGVGWTVYRERRENERMIRADAQRRVNAQLRGLAQRT